MPVIVIDPGHGGTGGGSDDGAVYNGATERFINMETAKAMYDELSQYEGVQVYLTHDSADTYMTLAERAEYAKSVDADWLISIHYNASESHIFYGSEVWIPSIGDYYVEGYRLADSILSEFTDMGLHIRGIKTRVGDDGDEYYGIIRESEWRGINAVIVEHCHIDNSNDKMYYGEAKDYEAFGRADAEAVARYYGLKSSIFGKDFSTNNLSENGKTGDIQDGNSGSNNIFEQIDTPKQRVCQDRTAPDICEVSLTRDIAGDGSVEMTIHAYDSESVMCYYSYSMDGGKEYSDLLEWEDTDEDNQINVILSGVSKNDMNLKIRAYNNYNMYTESQVLSLTGITDSINSNYTGEKVWYNGGKYFHTVFALILIIMGIMTMLGVYGIKHRRWHMQMSRLWKK